MAPNSEAIVASRSLSLTRSSPTPQKRVSPSAQAAATASTGTSSTRPGTSWVGTTVPVSAEPRTVRSPVSAACPMSAPIRASTSTKPVRPGPAYTFSTTTSDPATTAAATAQKAACEGSPATRWPNGTGRPGCTVTRPGPTDTSMPEAAISSSVWALVGLDSTTVVGPSAESPANSTHPFTCALATGGEYSIPERPPPSIVSGALVEPSTPETAAPMARSGASTRSMGRWRIDASPSSTDPNGSPASRPASSRMPVPELPT